MSPFATHRVDAALLCTQSKRGDAAFNLIRDALPVRPGNTGQRKVFRFSTQCIILPGGGYSSGSNPGKGGNNKPRKLILPDEEPASTSRGGVISAPTARQTYRPPPGFMDEASELADDLVTETVEEQLSILTNRAGYWHEYAKFISGLEREGIDASIIDEVTGITPVEQNQIKVASQVYRTLRLVSKLPAPQLAYFDNESGHAILYALRVLSVAQRRDAAAYIVENALDVAEAATLSRAIKDHERKRGGSARDAFESTPADCLAYYYYRMAGEKNAGEVDAKEAALRKGLEYASSEGARAAVEQALRVVLGEEEEVAEEEPAVKIELPYLRMLERELMPRAIPLAGELGRVAANDVLSVGKCTVSGAFNIMSVPQGGSYVPVPDWRILNRVADPVAVTVSNLSLLPGDNKTSVQDEQLIVIMDRGDVGPQLDPASYYFMARGGKGALEIGLPSALDKVVGRVLLVLRPPEEEVEEVVDFDD